MTEHNHKLKLAILNEADPGYLAEYIYKYSYSYKLDKDIFELCKRYIVSDPKPELSAACLKATLRFWSAYDCEIISSFSFFLDPVNYDDYFDEALLIYNFLSSEDGHAYTNQFLADSAKFGKWAKEAGLLEYQDLIQSKDKELR